MSFWEAVGFWAAKWVTEVALSLGLLVIVWVIFYLLTPKDKRP